jgi:glutamate synthase (ferredoxin)
MSGGVAYILDETGDFPARCNMQMVNLEKIEDPAEVEEVRQMIDRHAKYTRSQKALNVLARWEQVLPKFVKVMPKDYKRVLEFIRKAKESGLDGDQAIMAAFEANATNVARVGGS